MGLQLRSNVDISSYATKASTQVLDGLALLQFLDTSKNKAVNNFALGATATLSAVGTPTYDADGVDLNGGAGYLTTDVVDDEVDFTALFVMKTTSTDFSSTAGRPAALAASNAGSDGSTYGVGLGFIGGTATTLQMRIGYTPSAGGAAVIAGADLALSSMNINAYQLYGVRFSAAAGILMAENYTAALSHQTTIPGTRNLGNFKFSIGSFAPNGSGPTGPVSISQLRYYKRAISDAELATVLTEMRNYETWHNSRTV